MKYTLRQQLEAFANGGEILDNECSYFYDWFCNKNKLPTKAAKLMKKVKQFVELVGIDRDTHHVIFKNNCPLYGELYDDFRIISNRGEGYTVTPSSGFTSTKGHAEVYCVADGSEISFANWDELLRNINKLKIQTK